MPRKEIENLKNFLAEIREERLFLAVVTDYKFPQLVIINKNPKINEAEVFGIFVFPFVILKSDEERKSYTPLGIQRMKVSSFVGKINGISDSMLLKKKKSLDDEIEELKNLIK
ncbi:MAG: hypothetical protein WAV16_01660 [Candidatus Moraniibacteriota bacterium]